MSERKNLMPLIVGGGLAGCSAAIVLAKCRACCPCSGTGDFCGAKKYDRWRLYGHSLEKNYSKLCRRSSN